MTNEVGSEKFAARYFDAEARPTRLDSKLASLVMLIPVAAMVVMVGWWIVVDDVTPFAPVVWAQVALAGVVLWLFRVTGRVSSRERPRYLKVLSDGIEVHIPAWYETVVPYDSIARVELRPRYTLRDMILESFSFYGRVPERGEHVAIVCTRRVGARVPMRPFSWRMTFRAKVEDPRGFVGAANDRLARWRMSHHPGSGI